MPEQLPLRDIHLPPDIAWWPPAPGWWLLALLAAVALYAWLRYRRRLRIRVAAISELRQIEARYRDDQDDRALIGALSTLLRRVCLSYRPRRDVAALTGAAWRDALAGIPAPQARLSDAVAQQLCEAPYNPCVEFDPGIVLAEARRYCRALPALAEAG